MPVLEHRIHNRQEREIMRNYKKQGYSVSEAAQILHCSPATVRNMINSGSIGCFASSDHVEKGHKRTLRLSFAHLSDYIYSNRHRFDLETVNQFCKDRISTAKTKTEDTPVPTGAWKDLVSLQEQDQVCDSLYEDRPQKEKKRNEKLQSAHQWKNRSRKYYDPDGKANSFRTHG
jgi:hypothetical protein